ncbi:hypothetical protein CENSYa_0808 [Cenarchaeum symbiosum A]|uniref:Uncharacterized protein n=1 Tax=Cenarchaeum symbiosum (strain A) TaxID=414004 RepID=A0RVS4_CENSY|nr:hypothetical protein CENSYa_0808 [Cenarchaeum symbiosum A]
MPGDESVPCTPLRLESSNIYSTTRSMSATVKRPVRHWSPQVCGLGGMVKAGMQASSSLGSNAGYARLYYPGTGAQRCRICRHIQKHGEKPMSIVLTFAGQASTLFSRWVKILGLGGLPMKPIPKSDEERIRVMQEIVRTGIKKMHRVRYRFYDEEFIDLLEGIMWDLKDLDTMEQELKKMRKMLNAMEAERRKVPAISMD